MDLKKIEKETKKLTQQLLKLLEIKADVEVDVQDDKEQRVARVVIKSINESGLLIGNRGTTLAAIESFIAISLKQKFEDWVRVVLDIGDWRMKQDEYLVNLANQAAGRAKSTGEPQHLYNLTASQRRIVHTAVQEIDGVETVSEGEGENRYLVVKPE
jgi:spoIIIJ-associated protein